MLQSIYVSNYALIDELNIEFTRGLSIITGETGAGKSVLLGALQLLLGERSDASVLGNPEKKCVVEGCFLISDYHLGSFFRKNELVDEPCCILRREIHPAGRSRAFINDTPVNLSQLKELGDKLVDIHSQHDTLLLEKSAFQMDLLDTAAGNQKILSDYKNEFNFWKDTLKNLENLRQEDSRLKAEYDFNLYQFNEIVHAGVVPGEMEKLEDEFNSFSHAEEIRIQLSNALQITEGEEDNLGSKFKSLLSCLQQVSRYSNEARDIYNRAQTLFIEFNDIKQEINRLLDRSESDPQRLTEISNRIDDLTRILNKHRVNSLNDLIVIKDQLGKKLEDGNNLSTRIHEMELLAIKTEEKLRISAKELSDKRRKIIPDLENQITSLLSRLGMPDASFRIDLQTDSNIDISGTDKVGISFCANAGGVMRDIRKVASGGELSRLMLALKKIISEYVCLPTIIFDEIDTGVSGALADNMGDILEKMGKGMQVIAITHLPQIASKGESHLKVSKKIIGKKTFTKISRLSEKEKIEEIAMMLSGRELSDVAILNARILMGIPNE